MFELFSSFRPFEFIIIVIIIIAKKMDVNFERDDWNEEKKGKKKQSRESERKDAEFPNPYSRRESQTLGREETLSFLRNFSNLLSSGCFLRETLLPTTCG